MTYTTHRLTLYGEFPFAKSFRVSEFGAFSNMSAVVTMRLRAEA